MPELLSCLECQQGFEVGERGDCSSLCSVLRPIIGPTDLVIYWYILGDSLLYHVYVYYWYIRYNPSFDARMLRTVLGINCISATTSYYSCNFTLPCIWFS
jgi:hypothetical protein